MPGISSSLSSALSSLSLAALLAAFSLVFSPHWDPLSVTFSPFFLVRRVGRTNFRSDPRSRFDQIVTYLRILIYSRVADQPYAICYTAEIHFARHPIKNPAGLKVRDHYSYANAQQACIILSNYAPR